MTPDAIELDAAGKDDIGHGSRPRPDTEEPATENQPSETVQPRHPSPYTVFGRYQKAWTIAIAAWAGWFSTASSFAYFPAIPFMADQMKVSVEMVNLTVTSYLIVSGIFPTVTGSMADHYGRRKTLLVSLLAYSIINVGLAAQRSFPVLFVLRMLQSAAISGGYSITYGVVGDLASSAERGSYTGAVSIFLNTPPSIAPMISGLLLIRWTWSSIFWFLSIASFATFIIMLLFIPETARSIVGNGSEPTSGVTTPFIRILTPSGPFTPVRSTYCGKKEAGRNFNPLSACLVLKDRGTLTASICFGVYYMVQSCLQATLSTVFVETYKVSGLVAGLIYIPFGVGCSIAAFVAGRIVDQDYRKTAEKHGLTMERCITLEDPDFPFERARLRSCKYSLVACCPLIVAYGWTLQARVHMAAPLVLQFFIGFSNQILYTCLNTLLLDYWPGRGASVQAANNLIRCELAAIGLAVLDVMLRSLGPGWCFVLLAAIHFTTLIGFILLEVRGQHWRQEKTSPATAQT
ncbi:putative MFS transporter [Xylariomycetidae sp. FL0641]|nr:putative MFS transporter [Xylariomycetidae sp. FL0641]